LDRQTCFVMPRYKKYGERDSVPVSFGDNGFLGVNMRLEPDQLPERYVSNAVNMRFNRGIAETRPGMIMPTWANRRNLSTSGATEQFTTYNQFDTFDIPGRILHVVDTSLTHIHGLSVAQRVELRFATTTSLNGTWQVTTFDNNYAFYCKQVSSSITFPAFGVYNESVYILGSGGGSPPSSSGVVTGIGGALPWGTVYGIGVFDDPNTLRQYTIVATANGVWYTSPNNIPYLIPLPTNLALTGPVTFTQAFDVLIMHRGADQTVLSMSNIRDGFSEVSQSPPEPDDGLSAIPNSERSIFFQNRLFIPFGNDQVAFSDIGDYTRYLPVLNEFKINVGSSDKLVNIAKFNDTTMVCFKERSIYAVTDIYGDMSNARLDQVTSQFGLVAPKSVVQAGNDIIFLSQLGVMSLRQTEQNKLQGVVMPLSEPIQPLIDRINWKYASTAVGAYWDNRYYLAVPLDEALLFGPNLAPVSMLLTGSYYMQPMTLGRKYRWIPNPESTAVSDTVFYNGKYLGGVTRSGAVATFTTSQGSHGFTTGQSITMSGFNNSAYNVTATITVTTPRSFTYAVAGTPPTPDPNTGYATYTGGEIYQYADGSRFTTDFIAASSLGFVANTSGSPTSDFREITGTGVNTAILVFDFLNGAWAGYDICEGFAVKEFFIVQYNGRDRLFAMGADGFVKMMEEGYEDQLSQPYMDLYVAEEPQPNDTVKVNAGTLITANTSISFNTATNWSATDIAFAQRNLFADSSFAYGYYLGNETAVWTAPNTVVTYVDNVIRFYSTNGLLPTAELSLSSNWLVPVTTTTQQINSTVTTRFYGGNETDNIFFRWMKLAIETWHPRYDVELLMEGEAESYMVSENVTRSPAEWYKPFNKEPFDTDNGDGRFMDKFRKDYSVILSNDPRLPAADITDGIYASPVDLPTGIRTDLHQSVSDRYRINVDGVSAGIRITSDQGRFRLSSVSFEGEQRQTRGIVEA